MAGISESRENLLGSTHNLGYTQQSASSEDVEESLLTATEKKFLLYAERGDVATVRRLIEEYKDQPSDLNINCVDPLNRSALVTAIENENIELVHLLLEKGVRVKDALLHAIKEEYVEGVEVLLEWEERIHVPRQPYSWEAVNRASSAFTPDITPLILAAHMNNYEILKILLDRGATLPTPHDVRCGCDECILSSSTDSLRHSQSRINAYRALSASSLIALSSRDPLLTAFELSWEVRRLSFCETEFRSEYQEMRAGTQDFATALLDHARTSLELEVMLNFNLEGEIWEPGERQTLARLKLAIKYKQKKFVAHPNVQQLLASIWYDGLPGFRRKSMPRQLLEVARLGCMFPVYSTIYMIAPNSKQGQFMKKPFVKFICHSSSYAFFLMLLGLASQRAEFLVIEWFGPDWMQEILADWKRRERGAFPGLVESALVIYIFSWIFGEVKSLWSGGLAEYVGDLWNIVDFITNCFYMMWIGLRFSSIVIVQRDLWNGVDPYYPRDQWHPFDPMLLSEGAFAAGMIFSFLKLVHIFSVNPHLGPLQISLGRMIIDILKFFFIYTLVLFAFGCGMNQLMWYYADLEKKKCYTLPDPDVPDFDGNDKACSTWRRFANLFETSQSLFWASFGLVDLVSFDLRGIKSFTRFWALLLFGSYSVINIIVLLNMLIAMMSNSYQIIQERSDVEWKFARSRLWISYFDEGDTLPAPFNLMPTMKNVMKLFGCKNKENNRSGSTKTKCKVKAQERHDTVMRLLVRRFVMAEQTKRDDYGITEDDVMEIRQDISSLKYELVDILRNNGMKTPQLNQDNSAVSKKGKVMERRLIKDFQIGIVEGLVTEALKSDKGPKDVFSKIANAIGRRTSAQNSKKDWNAIVRKSIVRADPIGRADELQDRRSRQSIRRYIIEKNTDKESLDPERLVEYNPKLSDVAPAMRVAYAKFKLPKIKQEFEQVDKGVRKDSVEDGSGVPNQGTGDDDVFKASPGTKSPLALTPSGSIARPRPRSSLTSLTSALAAGSKDGSRSASVRSTDSLTVLTVNEVQRSTPEPDIMKDFRSRTPIPEDPRENAATPEPMPQQTEDSPEPPCQEENKENMDQTGTATESKNIEEKVEKEVENKENDGKEEVKGEQKNEKGNKEDEKIEGKKVEGKKDETTEDGSKAQSKDAENKEKKKEEPRKPLGPTKTGGKSTVTGEILTGWL